MPFHKLRETTLYRRVAAFTKRYERVWVPLMLIGGVIGDVIQYTTLNIRLQFAVMGLYLLVSSCAFLIISYPYAGQIRGVRDVRLVAPFLHQFAVGGLLSTSLLFYWFSGTSAVTWPVLLIVAALMLGNEFVREHFLRPTVQIGVLSFSVFSLSAILFSYVFNSLSAAVFLLGGGVSLFFMGGFALLLIRVGQFPYLRKGMLLTIALVHALLAACYFGNIIPPIPLALREAGIYHNLTVAGGQYLLEGEEENWVQQLLPGQTVHATEDDTLYAYTAVSAPADLSTTIVHKWQSYDPDTRRWTTVSTLSFPIAGGREGGYRGYSRKSRLVPGRWRVSVETSRGQVLGRIPFVVQEP